MSSSPVEYSIAPPARDPYRDRKAPWSPDAEQAVLAAMLLDADAVLRATELLDDSMFYQEGHRRIYRGMIALVERGAVIDPLTLADELERRGDLASSGGKDYLGVLLDAVPTASNTEYHARIVREKALLRRLIEVSTAIVGEAFEGRLSAAELLDDAEQKIFQVSQAQGAGGFVRIKELLWPTMERIEALQRGGRSITGVGSGFKDLDEMTSGFQPSELIIVAARPSMGKTAFVLNVAQHAALEGKVPVAFFSLEMSKDSLMERIISSEARVDAQKIRRGMLRDDDMPRIARAVGILNSAPIFIDDASSLTLLEMRSRARRLKAESGLGLVIIDYLQLIQGPASSENRQTEISAISRSLKALAKELQVPVIALSQLSRAPEQRTGESRGRPQLSDLRESGAIEQDADVVMGLYRPDYYAERDAQGIARDKDGNVIDGRAELIILKQRNGPTGSVDLFFHKQYTRFDNFTPRTTGAGAGGGNGGPAS